MAHDVFISYSSKNKTTADAICHILEEYEIKCWIAPRDIPCGSKYTNEINSAIISCEIFIIIFSENVLTSEWVDSEITLAISKGKIILSYRIDATPYSGGFELMLQNKHWIEAYPNPELKFNDLIKAVSLSIGKSTLNEVEKHNLEAHKQLQMERVKFEIERVEFQQEKQKNEILNRLEKGQVLEGIVNDIIPNVVIIDLGGVFGLIHITDLSWKRVFNPNEIVEIGQKLKVVILDFDDKKERIVLGLKQLSPDPWNIIGDDIKIGDKIKGKVVEIFEDFAVIEIISGIEGIIHISEMSWSRHSLYSVQDFMIVGDEVETIILTFDRKKRQISLGIKQLKSDPWKDIETRYPIGSKHTAKVLKFTNFSVFVEIEKGVEGLIHISDLSWTKTIKHPSEFTQIGEEVEVQILEIDKANCRLSLGHKQLEENPWDVLEAVFTLDSVHDGIVIEMFDKGAVISLPFGVEGFATIKHLVKENGTSAKVDDKLQFKVIDFDKDAKRIILSHTLVWGKHV